MKVELRQVAHSRSGDKGNTLNVAVIAYEPTLYPVIKSQLTVQTVSKCYSGIFKGAVVRYEVDRLGVLNFVFERALDGGVSRTLRLDSYGKALGSKILTLPIDISEDQKIYLRSKTACSFG